LHRKGLTLLILFVLVLAGCGGAGGSDPSTSQTTISSPAVPSSRASAEARLPKQAKEKLREIEAKAAKRRAKRDAKQGPSAQPPKVAHHDSGGGSAQFEAKGADNSIEEFGEEASAQEREEAAGSLHAYLDSYAAGRWAAACSYMSTQMIAGLEQLPRLGKQAASFEGCPKTLAAINAHPGSQAAREAAARADVASLRAEAGRGFILYRGAGGVYEMPMALEDGVWRVGSIAGSPLF
jgi:hypothetical protein